MKKTKFRLITVLFVIVLAFASVFTFACGSKNKSSDKEAINAFYSKVSSIKPYMDEYGNEIYRYWYDAIFNKKYSGDINKAISQARSDNAVTGALIRSYNRDISDSYQEIKNKTGAVKDLMRAYSNYYDLIINTSGSFNTYKSNLSECKNALKEALTMLSYELND